MATNPMNLLKTRAESAEVRHKNLAKEHDKLIKEAVILDNKVQAYETAIEKMCDGCTTKGTSICDTCPIYKVATENKLWKELE